MKAYTYTPAECGRESWPSGELRLEGVESTTDPDSADVFIYPGQLIMAWKYGLDLLPFMRGKEDRHVFLDVSDHFEVAIGKPCMFIRCNMRTWMKAEDPNSIPCPWPVEDYAECGDVPEGGFKYDVSGHMWISTDTRDISTNACLNSDLTCDIARYQDFTGYIFDEPEGLRRRAEFRRSMKESRLCLCPESIPGVLPYRFFEAMSAGRVPVLVSSDYVLPFADEVPYSEFIIAIERYQADRTAERLLNYLSIVPDEQLVAMGKEARKYWEKYLDCRLWPKTMAKAVEKQLHKMGLLTAAA